MRLMPRGRRLQRFTPVVANETERDERVNAFLARGGGDILAIAEAHAVAIEGDLEGCDKAIDFVLIWGYESDDSTEKHVQVGRLPVDTDKRLPCNRPQSIMWYHEDRRYPYPKDGEVTTVTHVVITGSKSLPPAPIGPLERREFYAFYDSPLGEEEVEWASTQALRDTERYLLAKISTGKAREFIVVQTTRGTHTFSGSVVDGIYSAKSAQRSSVWWTYSEVFRNAAIMQMVLENKFMHKKPTGGP